MKPPDLQWAYARSGLNHYIYGDPRKAGAHTSVCGLDRTDWEVEQKCDRCKRCEKIAAKLEAKPRPS